MTLAYYGTYYSCLSDTYIFLSSDSVLFPVPLYFDGTM